MKFGMCYHVWILAIALQEVVARRRAELLRSAVSRRHWEARGSPHLWGKKQFVKDPHLCCRTLWSIWVSTAHIFLVFCRSLVQWDIFASVEIICLIHMSSSEKPLLTSTAISRFVSWRLKGVSGSQPDCVTASCARTVWLVSHWRKGSAGRSSRQY